MARWLSDAQKESPAAERGRNEDDFVGGGAEDGSIARWLPDAQKQSPAEERDQHELKDVIATDSAQTTVLDFFGYRKTSHA